ncbi:MAG: MnhB domain-containing protein [Acidimicrobiales bacterium]|nr:MnhB domain-containing protein [Acidimicrobiales bacterium]
MIASRSPIVRLGVRAASPLAIVIAVYLLFAGHNRPGGGFAAGLVLGAVVTLRTLAGLQRPTHATGLITSGVVLVAAIAFIPLLWGDPLLDQQVGSIELPVLGKVKSGSALPFDIGVTAIVMGLIVALLDGLSDPTAEGGDPAPVEQEERR